MKLYVLYEGSFKAEVKNLGDLESEIYSSALEGNPKRVGIYTKWI